ncbi:hypothetical protein [Bacillus paranthracis]|uniref:hypothetical protein n=1 Tax=Bacillus paranthracis TaxID=2026186 RepID=UPI003558EA9B
MTKLHVNAHSTAKTDIFYLINGHFYGEDRRDITVVLDRDDALDFIKSADLSLYEETAVDTEGEFFYVTSSVTGSFLYIENVKTQNGVVKGHEGDILILPHYVPQNVRQECIDGSETVIELALESIYEKLVEIIKG